MNQQLWLLQRVVLHPTWRGAGIAASFVRRACELCPVPWIETLARWAGSTRSSSEPGFRRVGVIRKGKSRERRLRREAEHESQAKSRYSEPVYYVFDNRGRRFTQATQD